MSLQLATQFTLDNSNIDFCTQAFLQIPRNVGEVQELGTICEESDFYWFKTILYPVDIITQQISVLSDHFQG